MFVMRLFTAMASTADTFTSARQRLDIDTSTVVSSQVCCSLKACCLVIPFAKSTVKCALAEYMFSFLFVCQTAHPQCHFL